MTCYMTLSRVILDKKLKTVRTFQWTHFAIHYLVLICQAYPQSADLLGSVGAGRTFLFSSKLTFVYDYIWVTLKGSSHCEIWSIETTYFYATVAVHRKTCSIQGPQWDFGKWEGMLLSLAYQD